MQEKEIFNFDINSADVQLVTSQKHVGLILDSKLDFDELKQQKNLLNLIFEHRKKTNTFSARTE